MTLGGKLVFDFSLRGEMFLFEQVQFPGEQHELGNFCPIDVGFLHVLVKPNNLNIELIILKHVGIMMGNLITQMYGINVWVSTPNPLFQEDHTEDDQHDKADQKQDVDHPWS